MFGSNIVFFILYDHSIHDSKSRMVNGHFFVSLTMSVPVYEHKTFWSIDKYMVRKHIGIEHFLTMINIAHSMTKILPYIDNMFYEYRNMSAQEFRHKLTELINKEIFFGSLADCAQTAKNSDIIMEFLAAMGRNQGYAA